MTTTWPDTCSLTWSGQHPGWGPNLSPCGTRQADWSGHRLHMRRQAPKLWIRPRYLGQKAEVLKHTAVAATGSGPLAQTQGGHQY